MPRTIIGKVTSDVQDKTIVVTQTNRRTHYLYGKQYSINRKFTAHDEKNKAKKGDLVEISEHRPISKKKTWILSKIVNVGQAEIELKDELEDTV